MAKTDIKIKSMHGGENVTTTITYVNPEATNAKLAEFGAKLIALTTNTYQSTDKVVTINCDTEE